MWDILPKGKGIDSDANLVTLDEALELMKGRVNKLRQRRLSFRQSWKIFRWHKASHLTRPQKRLIRSELCTF